MHFSPRPLCGFIKERSLRAAVKAPALHATRMLAILQGVRLGGYLAAYVAICISVGLTARDHSS